MRLIFFVTILYLVGLTFYAKFLIHRISWKLLIKSTLQRAVNTKSLLIESGMADRGREGGESLFWCTRCHLCHGHIHTQAQGLLLWFRITYFYSFSNYHNQHFQFSVTVLIGNEASLYFDLLFQIFSEFSLGFSRFKPK